jgi:hypothetical protein
MQVVFNYNSGDVFVPTVPAGVPGVWLGFINSRLWIGNNRTDNPGASIDHGHPGSHADLISIGGASPAHAAPHA